MTAPTDPAAPRAGQRPGDRGDAAPPTGPASARTRLAAAVTELPSRLPLVLFWLTLVVSVTILLNLFTAAVVLPAVLVLVVLTWRWAPDRLPASTPALRGAILALTGAACWVLIGLRYTAEVMLVERDPGFLTLEGLWLSHNADPDIPIRTAADVLAQIPGARATSDAFWLDGSALTAQGAKAFPGLIATFGWGGGQTAVLGANVVIGGLALLALYDLGRRLLSPYWALLPMAALALTTPMLYFTRAPFTEPVNLVVTFTGLAVIWGALRRPRAGHFVLGGALLGAPALSRIDGAAVAAGLLLGLGLVAGASRAPQRRRELVRGFVLASVAALAMVALGYLDVRVNSTGYLSDHRALYLPLIGLLAGCVVTAGLAILLGPHLAGWLDRHRRVLAGTAMCGVLAGAVFLASRPLWWEAHRTKPGSGQASFIASVQASAGVAVDGTRSYDEQTVTWLAWYLGVGTVILAAVGAALMLRESIARRRASLFVLLVTLGVPTLLYLLRPSITPDQIWAMRRFLPAALPMVLLCAVVAAPTGRRLGRRGEPRRGRLDPGPRGRGAVLPASAHRATVDVGRARHPAGVRGPRPAGRRPVCAGRGQPGRGGSGSRAAAAAHPADRLRRRCGRGDRPGLGGAAVRHPRGMGPRPGARGDRPSGERAVAGRRIGHQHRCDRSMAALPDPFDVGDPVPVLVVDRHRGT